MPLELVAVAVAGIVSTALSAVFMAWIAGSDKRAENKRLLEESRARNRYYDNMLMMSKNNFDMLAQMKNSENLILGRKGQTTDYSDIVALASAINAQNPQFDKKQE
jgi:Tfp pilus assembly protein PilE